MLEDPDKEGVLSLERKSMQGFETKDEYLYAMKEDLSEWFNTLYGLNMNVDNFFTELETGVILCQHANNVQSFILQRLKENDGKPLPLPRGQQHSRTHLPESGVQYRENVRPGTFQCRDNVSNFITWCRGLGLPDCVLFETEDLVMRKNERSCVLCMLEVARQGAKYGMQAPLLVQLEEEIEAEIAGAPPPKPTPTYKRYRVECDLMSLDEMVSKHLHISYC